MCEVQVYAGLNPGVLTTQCAFVHVFVRWPYSHDAGDTHTVSGTGVKSL